MPARDNRKPRHSDNSNNRAFRSSPNPSSSLGWRPSRLDFLVVSCSLNSPGFPVVRDFTPRSSSSNRGGRTMARHHNSNSNCSHHSRRNFSPNSPASRHRLRSRPRRRSHPCRLCSCPRLPRRLPPLARPPRRLRSRSRMRMARVDRNKRNRSHAREFRISGCRLSPRRIRQSSSSSSRLLLVIVRHWMVCWICQGWFVKKHAPADQILGEKAKEILLRS